MRFLNSDSFDCYSNCFVARGIEHISWQTPTYLKLRCVTTARKKPVENDLRKYSHRIPQRVHTLPHRIHVLMYGISTKSTIHGSQKGKYDTCHLSGLLWPKFGWGLERSRVVCLETCPSPIFVVGRGRVQPGQLALMGPSFFLFIPPPLKVGITPACFGQILNSLLSNSAGGSGNLYLCIYDITANVPRNFIT